MSLLFHKITNTQPVTEYLVNQIQTLLKQDKTILWLVPGGSSIAIAAEVSKRLTGKPLEQLHVTLTDERYGDVDHPHSNWRQLREAGFSLPDAQLFPVLQGKDREQTVVEYAAQLKALFNTVDYSIGFFGIGADGHTAGILPDSPAVAASNFATGYDAGNFQRVTMTPTAIQQLDEAVAYAVGEAKWPVLDSLTSGLPLHQQPVQILKKVQKTTIFNDYRDSEA